MGNTHTASIERYKLGLAVTCLVLVARMCYTGEAVGPAKVRHGVLVHLVTTESATSSVAAAFFDLAEIFQLGCNYIIVWWELQEKFERNGTFFE